MVVKLLSLLCFLAVLTDQTHSLPLGTRQLLVVTTESWRSTGGSLQRYQSIEGKWRAIGRPIPVSVGRHGLAWARGMQSNWTNGREKQEGDGCAPAGVFAIGPAFGYAARAPARCRLPYRGISERDYFIDDPTSADYNQWVSIPGGQPNRPERRWKSFEKMQRRDHLYELGIVIQQNDRPVMKGKGSAVFFHVWNKAGAATAGCTAMTRDDLLVLLRWLDPSQKPLLVQAPVNEIENILSINLTP